MRDDNFESILAPISFGKNVIRSVKKISYVFADFAHYASLDFPSFNGYYPPTATQRNATSLDKRFSGYFCCGGDCLRRTCWLPAGNWSILNQGQVTDTRDVGGCVIAITLLNLCSCIDFVSKPASTWPALPVVSICMDDSWYSKTRHHSHEASWRSYEQNHSFHSCGAQLCSDVVCELILPENQGWKGCEMAKKISQPPIVCWIDRLDTFCAIFHARVSDQNSALVLSDCLLALFLHFYRYLLYFLVIASR